MNKFSINNLKNILCKELGLTKLPPQIDNAYKLAYEGHEGQYRESIKKTKNRIPYIVHPIGVAVIAHKYLSYVKLEDSYDDIISACLAHDLIEDSNISTQRLANETSNKTMQLVLSLTKPMVQVGSTNHERNILFFKQIINAGPTAIFIKICDHCHNLSKPNQTPIHLMEKAIQKGHNLILEYFDYAHFSTDFKNEYLEILKTAERDNNIRKESENGGLYYSITDAINYCTHIATSKVLEIHDITLIIKKILNASFVKVQSEDAFIHERISKDFASFDQKLRQQVEKQFKRNFIDIVTLPKEIRQTQDYQYNRVIIIQPSRSIYFDNSHSLYIGLNDDYSVDWASPETIQIIVSFLIERLWLQEKEVEKNLLDELKIHNLDVDIEDIRTLQFSTKNIQDFRHTLSNAKLLMNKLKLDLEHKIFAQSIYKNSITIENRIKTPKSIIDKMIKYKNQCLSELDDLIGFRFVCLAQKDVDDLSCIIISCLGQYLENVQLGSNSLEQPIVKNVISSNGYKALHIYSTLPIKNEKGIFINCEFQIRTIFQDAWAKASHLLHYKESIYANSKPNKKWEENIKNLADLRDNADKIINELLRSK